MTEKDGCGFVLVVELLRILRFMGGRGGWYTMLDILARLQVDSLGLGILLSEMEMWVFVSWGWLIKTSVIIGFELVVFFFLHILKLWMRMGRSQMVSFNGYVCDYFLLCLFYNTALCWWGLPLVTELPDQVDIFVR